MLDFRVKGSIKEVNWRYFEIVVDQAYLDSHSDLNLVKLDKPYEMGVDALDVFLNGNRLRSGGEFEEVDSTTIRLKLGHWEDDEFYPETLILHDELVIKEWFNISSCLYGQDAFNDRLAALEKEVRDARNYADDPILYNSLRERLNAMQDQIDNMSQEGFEELRQEIERARGTFPELNDRLDYIEELAKQGGGSTEERYEPLLYRRNVTYTTDAEGVVIREEDTGDFPYDKTLIYSGGRLATTVTLHDGNSYIMQYTYDDSTNTVIEKGQVIDFLPTMTLHNYLKPITYSVIRKRTYNAFGNLIREIVTGDLDYSKMFYYGTDGLLVKEDIELYGEIYSKYYTHSDGRLQSEEGFSMDIVISVDTVTCSLYKKDVLYVTDELGNVTKETILGTFSYTKDYEYLDGRVITETITKEDVEYVKTFSYDVSGAIHTVEGTAAREYGNKLDVAYRLSGKMQKSLGYLLGEGNYDVEFTYNSEGKITGEQVTGEYSVTKTYTYNAAGKIETEVMVYGNKTITKTYRYNSDGKVSGFSCVTE